MVKLNVAVLQLNPRIGGVKANIEQANAILAAHGYPTSLAPPGTSVRSPKSRRKLDLLILPELAFTGYNFKSPAEIKPYLEPTSSGVSTEWAKQTSRALGCHVLVGYPEKHYKTGSNSSRSVSPPALENGTSVASIISNELSAAPSSKSQQPQADDSFTIYNSAVMVSPTGSVLFNYRKSFLYEADENWGCSESPDMKYGPDSDEVFPLTGVIMVDKKKEVTTHEHMAEEPEKIPLKVQVGICMDLNPYRFETPFTNFEFAHAAIRNDVSLVLCPMAWLHSNSPDIPSRKDYQGPPDMYEEERERKLVSITSLLGNDPDSPNRSNVNYWIQRMAPLFYDDFLSDSEKNTYKHKKILMVTCNRTGIEDYTAYAGSSSIYVFNEDGKVGYYGSLGQGEEALMVREVDVDE